MNGILKENVIVREYEFNEPLIQKIDSIFDEFIRDCRHKCFHTFDPICEYDIQLTNIANIEIVNFTISARSMASYDLNKKN